MLPSLLLGGALAIGQPPSFPTPPAQMNPPRVVEVGRVAPPPVVPVGWAAQPDPKTTPPGAPPAKPDPLDLSVVVPAPPAPAEEPAEAPAAPTRYAFMRAAQGTWLGNLLDDNRITVFGWTQFYQGPSTASGSNLPITFNDRAGEFLMHQNYLHVERTIDTSKREYQFGFVSETILPGADYRFTLPRGLFNRQLTDNNGRPNLYGIDPFQFYVQSFLPDLGPRGTKVITGRFATPVGYELVQAPDTPFLSRSYLFQYNPFSHTGTLATSQLTDAWSVSYGAATGIDTFIDSANRLTFLGQVKWAPPTGRASVTFNTVLTRPEFDEVEAFAYFNVYDLVFTYKVSDRMGYAANATYSHIDDVPGTGFTDWFGVAQYLTYQFTPTVSATTRVELFNDSTGFRTGSEGLYTAVTAGVTWKPVQSLLVRPSIRFDHNNQTRPFDGSPNLLTAGLDLIVRW